MYRLWCSSLYEDNFLLNKIIRKEIIPFYEEDLRLHTIKWSNATVLSNPSNEIKIDVSRGIGTYLETETVPLTYKFVLVDATERYSKMIKAVPFISVVFGVFWDGIQRSNFEKKLDCQSRCRKKILFKDWFSLLYSTFPSWIFQVKFISMLLFLWKLKFFVLSASHFDGFHWNVFLIRENFQCP